MTYEKRIQALSSIELITSAIAAEMLEKSKGSGKIQRPISPKRVRAYETEIRQGRWMLTPTHSIGIADDGFIVDGQHRLSAIAALGLKDQRSVPMWVCRGVDPGIFSVIDRGLGRSDYQIAQIAGTQLNMKGWSAIRLAMLNVEQAKKGQLPKIVNVDDIEAVERYFADACNLAFPKGFKGHSRFETQGFRAALIRAFKNRADNPIDTQKIKNFAYTVMTGECVDFDVSKDRCPLLLSTYFVLNPVRSGCSGVEHYNLTLKSLWAYMQGLKPKDVSAMRKYKDIDNSLFPLAIDYKHKLGDITWSELIKKATAK